MTEIEHEYVASGGAAQLLLCHATEVLFEGPAGTGKTRAVLHKIADLCEAYPKTRALICRATRASCTESILVTLERDVLPPGYPWIAKDATRAHRDSYDCVNKSTIVVGGLDKAEKLYSTEWDIVYVAESIEITEDAWEKFARAMRNRAIPLGVNGGPKQEGEAQAVGEDGRPLFWTQRIADCNPGAPGHWLNQRANAGKMVRIKSRHQDNPSVTQDFLDGLKALSGHRRARLYEGRWVAAEGSVFPEFDEERHVIPDFPVPDTWPCWWLHDAGYDHPAATLCVALAPNDRIYVMDEKYISGWRVKQHAEWIHTRNAGRNVQGYYADPRDCFKEVEQGPSIANQFAAEGLTFLPWPRKQGVAVQGQVELLRRRLTDLDKLHRPMFQVFRSCSNTIAEFQSWAYKRAADGSIPPGDDAYEDRNNHALDCLLGFVATNPRHSPQRIEVYSSE